MEKQSRRPDWGGGSVLVILNSALLLNWSIWS